MERRHNKFMYVCVCVCVCCHIWWSCLILNVCHSPQLQWHTSLTVCPILKLRKSVYLAQLNIHKESGSVSKSAAVSQNSQFRQFYKWQWIKVPFIFPQNKKGYFNTERSRVKTSGCTSSSRCSLKSCNMYTAVLWVRGYRLVQQQKSHFLWKEV